tara:strand:+ start:1224 stop:1751 length:528 start_codon:yes stop_codon:yes gene_type:complete
MYTEGFVKLHRKALETSILKKPKTFSFFVYCLMKAVWRDTKQIRNGDEITVYRGSFWTTEKEDLEALGMTRAERETCLKTLTNCESLFVVPSHEGTLIEVCNFDRYQDQDEQHGTNMEPTGNEHGTNMEPTRNRHGTKEENKKKIKENKRISKNELSPSAQKFIQKLKLKERNHA